VINIYINRLKLRILMAEKGLNFRKLSELSGVSKNTLSNINNGKTCNGEVLIRITKVLEINPGSLLEELKMAQ